jgi:tRNA-uridine 2-sulfurtransferase
VIVESNFFGPGLVSDARPPVFGHPRIAVAMSGGMDSTATALLLKRAGYEVLGIHMRLHEGSDRTWALAKKAASEVDVPIRAVDLSREFESLVINDFVHEYAVGRTPSPCPRCNRVVKMTLLFEKALEFGCSRIATGHYARISGSGDDVVLRKAVDRGKDQSYFLFMLTREILNRTMFPLGDRTKGQVRELLRLEGISVWEAPESQELCFIPGRDYRGFLADRGIETRPGPVLDTAGRVRGEHKGLAYYTVGQRRGIGVCGPDPLYVLRIDATENAVIVGTKDQTVSRNVRIERPNIILPRHVVPGDRFEAKIRSTAKPAWCTVVAADASSLSIEFDTPQSAVAPGQAAVLYDGEVVCGGGWIASAHR